MFQKLLEKCLDEFARGYWRRQHDWICPECDFKIRGGELLKYCKKHNISYDKEKFPQPCPKCGTLMDYF